MRCLQIFCLFVLAASGCLRAEDTVRPLFPFEKRDGLPNVNQKLTSGQPVTIAYLGGSITLQKGWRVLIGNWFAERYPSAKINNVCAAIGGTGSWLGAYRLGSDVLRYKPDLVFVEFAVNDYKYWAPDMIRSDMEGIVRQIWQANPQTDICFVYTVSEPMLPEMEAGRLPLSANVDEDVATHYHIPSICMAYEIPNLIREGKLIYKGDRPTTPEEKAKLAGKILFSGDGTHPYEDSGHLVYLEALKKALPDILVAGSAGPHPLPSPLMTPNAEDAKIAAISGLKRSGTWEKLDPASDPLAQRFQGNLPDLWKAATPGSKITFNFKGTAFGLYGLLGPDCGKISVAIDGVRKEEMFFDSYCTDYRLGSVPCADGLPDTLHSVTIEVLPNPPDKAAILGAAGAADLKSNPKKYDGVNLYVGGLLLRGQIVDPNPISGL
jgi:hypothetical protein